MEVLIRTGEMESIERHLGRRFADTISAGQKIIIKPMKKQLNSPLRCQKTNRLTRLHQTPHILHIHQQTEILGMK